MPAQDYTKWKLPQGAKARLGKGYINEIAYSPDSSRLAVASSIGIWIYDTDTGEELDLFTGDNGAVEKLRYSPDGTTIVTEDYIGVCLRNAATGEQKITLTGNVHTVKLLAYSPDGNTIAARDGHGHVYLWDAATGEQKITLIGNARAIEFLTYSPDGNTIAAKIGRDEVWLWDAATGKQKIILTHDYGIDSLAYSPDGSTIATGSNKEVRLWDVVTGEHKTTLTGYAHSFSLPLYSPDGSIVATGSGISSDGTIRLWDVVTGEHKTTLTHIGKGMRSGDVMRLVYSSDGSTVVTGGCKKVRLWDAATGEQKAILSHDDLVDRLICSPDGNTIATESFGKIHLWDAVTGEHKTILTGHTGSIRNIVYSPDGNTIAVCYDDYFGNYDEIVRLWDVTTGKHGATLIGHTGSIRSIVYSPDGGTIATKGYKKVHLWDAITGKHKAALIGHAHGVEALEYSPDGNTIITGNRDGTVLLWEAASFLHQEPSINPREIHGNWRSGWALDVHSVSSHLLQEERYNTERTELGESIYQLKYHYDRSKIQPLAEIAAKFLKEEFKVDGHLAFPYIQAILPIPLSPNSASQPVPEIATQIGRILDVPVPLDYLIKVKTTGRHNFESEESRREQLHGAFAVQVKDRKYRCVLLLDDIYNSGVTLTEATDVLQKQGSISHVLALTLTYTRKKR